MKLFSRLRNPNTGSSIGYRIQPRKVKFEWRDTPVDWVPQQPFVSYFINEINMILPAGEFWFCRLYNKVLPQIRDEKLKADVQAFIRQEAMHAQAHHSANTEYLAARNIDIQRNLAVMDFLFGKLLADEPESAEAAAASVGSAAPRDYCHRGAYDLRAGQIRAVQHRMGKAGSGRRHAGPD